MADGKDTKPYSNAEEEDGVPAPLRYWQVVVDEEWGDDTVDAVVDSSAVDPTVGATVHEHADFSEPSSRNSTRRDSAGSASTMTDPTSSATPRAVRIVEKIADQHDSVIVASLHTDELTVNPGQAAVFQVSILNNGPKSAVFHLHVEGWIDESWLAVSPISTQLQPGERAALDVTITPTRAPTSAAGAHPLAIVTRSPDYPAHSSRLGAVLIITPYDELIVGDVQPRRLTAGPRQRPARARLPIANRGNQSTVVRIDGHEYSRTCRFEFARPDSGVWQADELRVELAPGQTMVIPVQILPLQERLIGRRSAALPFRLAVSVDDRAQTPQWATGRLESRPLIGPWHIGAISAALLAAALLTALALMGMGSLLLLQTTAPPAPALASPPQVITVMLNTNAAAAPATDLDRNDPTVNGETAGGADLEPLAPPDANAEPNGATAGIPIVQADQVSAPGMAAQPLPIAPVVAPDALSAAPAAAAPRPDSGMTYAEMFQLVARQYDLDWRMLAAQAYIESNFDALALGNDGDLGLMQILPGTWREWAPTVDASRSL